MTIVRVSRWVLHRLCPYDSAVGYYFPQAGVFVTAMAKTGCSTVLNLLVAVEERLV